MANKSKRDDILATAGKLFMENGFQAVTMDQIAATVPVSKPTLYANFKDKRDLFVAVISQRCERALTNMKAGIAEGKTVEDHLTGFATQFLDLLLSTQALQLHRVMVGESESFPEMSRQFYETGPKQMHALLEGYLSKATKDGFLSVSDPALSADIFVGMIKGRLHLKALLGLNDPTDAERKKLVKTAVKIFIAGHAKV